MQKKDPKYYDHKEETAWTMEQFKYLDLDLTFIVNKIFDILVNILMKMLHQIKILKKIGQ